MTVAKTRLHWWPVAVIGVLLLNGCASFGLPEEHANCMEGLTCIKGPQIEPSS